MKHPLHWSLFTFIPFTAFILFLDSTRLQPHGFGGQIVADLLVCAYFMAMIRTLDDPQLVRMMWLAVPISAVGEIAISMGLDVWVYRNHVVPVYVPFGHAIVIGTGFQAVRLAWFRRQVRWIVPTGGVTYCALMLAAAVKCGDTLSLVCAGIFGLGLLAVEQRLPYMVMPLPVLFVECVGTFFGCWRWPRHPLGVLSTTNPPIGSIALYVGLDLVVLLAANGWTAKRLAVWLGGPVSEGCAELAESAAQAVAPTAQTVECVSAVSDGMGPTG